MLKRRTLWALPLAALAGGAAFARPKARSSPPPPPPPPAAAPSSAGLTGAWTLLSAETFSKTGDPTPAFGYSANGLLIYDRSGLMSLQIAGERPGASLTGYQAMDADERVQFLDSYYAYFGSYSVDEAAKQVIHRVRASLRPTEAGATFRRQFLIEGDRLTLATPPETVGGETVTNRLVFVRAR